METRTPGGSGEPPSFPATLDPADVLALRMELEDERTLCLAVMRVSAKKDEELDAVEAKLDWQKRFGLVAVSVATIAGTAAAVLAAKIAGLW